jgi:DNA modification methylase
MAVLDQEITDRWAVYNGDCVEVMAEIPDESIHLSIYSPPFAGLYHYSSSERDLSNARSYEEFMEHYGYVIGELHRITLPGRMTVVHCMDVPTSNSGANDALLDFPGDIIRLHEAAGWKYVSRRCIWKEPLAVRNRTMVKGLAHKTIVDDSSQTAVAGADYLIAFRRSGTNEVPIAHPTGLSEYFGVRQIPAELVKYRNYAGKQTENRYSHWIWRQYASAFWDDIRGNQGDPKLDAGGVLPYREARDSEDEKHVHPLQLDVIGRAVALWSNPGERVLTPFMGVGSEVYGAVRQGRIGIGVELKPSYYRQALKNLAAVDESPADDQLGLFD